MVDHDAKTPVLYQTQTSGKDRYCRLDPHLACHNIVIMPHSDLNTAHMLYIIIKKNQNATLPEVGD